MQFSAQNRYPASEPENRCGLETGLPEDLVKQILSMLFDACWVRVTLTHYVNKVLKEISGN